MTAAGCSGGGGDGARPQGPVILSATFVGGSTPPQAGNRIWVFLSEDIQLNAQAVLSDEDFILPPGASLGAITEPPTLLSSQSIQITLGTGVALDIGTTTISWSPDNDVVANATGQGGSPGTPAVIGWSDGVPPTLNNVTIASIDDELNGTGPAGGRLQVPRNGWTLELAFADDQAVDHVAILADVPVQTPSGTAAAGTDLHPFLTETNVTATGAHYAVGSSVWFPASDVTLTCAAIDTSGLASAAQTFPLRTTNLSDALRPFETQVNASQVWYIDFSRDEETFTTTPFTGGANIGATTTPNGIPDFEDMLRVLGLNTDNPLPNVSGGLNSNQVVQDLFEDALIAALDRLYAGANVTFTTTRPTGTFGSNASVPYASFGYSQISVAGSPSSPGTLGVAIYDLRNETQDDDTRFDYGGTRLGIFLFTIIEAGLQPPASTPFRLTFSQFTPALNGTAIGEDAADGQRLNGALQDARATAIDTAIVDFAQFTAIVLGHECGHSMGLVANGPMPQGLYGNDPVNFPGSIDGHISNDDLFPPGSTNVMSPSLAYSLTLHPSTAFNSLNMAYLRELVFYGN